MKALVTGASSGIGREISKYLSSLGYDLILVGRDKDSLLSLQKELKTNAKIVVADLPSMDKLKEVYVVCKNDNIDVLVNNAGFGLYGEFNETNLETELNMIDINVRAVHVLTKFFLKDMIKRDKGYILNVSSIAGFSSGPLMATYYATKGYVTKLTTAIYEELRRKKSKVHISCLCPGPVKTNFNKTAGVKFKGKSMESKDVAKYAVDKMFKNKLIIIPGTKFKLAKFFNRFASDKFSLKVVYNFQKKKK